MARRRFPSSAAVLLALVALGVRVGPAMAQPARVAVPDIRSLQNYGFDPSTPVAARIRPAPDMVMAYLREMDKRPDYAPYTPTAAERAQCEQYLELLPPLNREVMRDRLVGIYFVTGFLSSGMSDYVWGPDHSMYTILVLSPDALHRDLSAWLTYRENTCFGPNVGSFPVATITSGIAGTKPRDIGVLVDCGTQFTGLMYALLHESTHIVDYVRRCTPYVEPDLRKMKGFREGDHAFVNGIWSDYRQPVLACDFPFRRSVTLYGLGGGPKIAIRDVPTVYRQLAETPFVSLYGSTSWAEDLAEVVTFHHLTTVLKQPYAIQCVADGKVIGTWEPMKSPKVAARLPTIQQFYQEAAGR